jgi:pimeloyl-ACP methyl ester carboxylesterase
MSQSIIIGNWKGSINLPGTDLEIIITFKQEGQLSGAISIPLQNLSDFPLANIEMNDKNISFNMPIPNQQMVFEGTVEGDQIKGTFTQQGHSFPFQLDKAEISPQESSKEEELFMSIETEEGTLYGSIVLPDEVTPCPVVLIIPGSGPTDRDGNSHLLPGKNNSLKMLATALAEHGIASLRYDKRGAGKNFGAVTPEIDTRFELFINDATQWITTLKNDPRFTKVGVIGHSEGSLVGMVAAKLGGADSYVSLEGAGRPIDQVLREQIKGLPADLDQQVDMILADLRDGKTNDHIDEKLVSLFRPSAQPYLISWMKYDPAEEIAKLEIPVLIINGTHDIQVPVTDAERMKAAKNDAGLLIVENMNHVLKEAPEGVQENIKTYSDPSLPLAQGLIEGLINFYK